MEDVGDKISLTDATDGKTRLTTNTTLLEVWNVTKVLADVTEVPDSAMVGLQLQWHDEGSAGSLEAEEVASVWKAENVDHSMTDTALLLPASFLRQISQSESGCL